MRLSRRSFVSAAGFGTAAAMTGALAGARSAQAVADVSRQRIVVIGGGIAGVTTAWLLDGKHDVTVLEATPSLGGHATSTPLYTNGGRKVTVDLGAQFFGPQSHPIYTDFGSSG